MSRAHSQSALWCRFRRSGFVLLAVLWVMLGALAAGMGIALMARREAAHARSRRNETRAEWVEEDCAQRALAVVADALANSDTVNGIQAAAMRGRGARWADLDGVLATSPELADPPLLPSSRCRIGLHPTGRAIDINTADDELLTRAFQRLGVSPAVVDSLVDAVLDWRDPDNVPRPHGAEEAWYVGQGRAPPRNGPFANVLELHRVRGLEHLAGLDSMFGVDPDGIVLSRAPLSVVGALPGFTSEAVSRIAEHRVRGAPIGDLLAFSAELSPVARDSLRARYQDLVRMLSPEPDAWILTVQGTVGLPPITTTLELRLARAGTRAAIVRRLTWVE